MCKKFLALAIAFAIVIVGNPVLATNHIDFTSSTLEDVDVTDAVDTVSNPSLDYLFYADPEDFPLTTVDLFDDPEAVIIPNGRTSTAPFSTFSSSDHLEVVKGNSLFTEPDAGAHYYAFTAQSTTYTEAYTKVILPTRCNIGERHGYISLGIHGDLHGIDMGLMNDGEGWWPVYNDVQSGVFATFPSYIAPNTAKSATIVVTAVDETTVRFFVQFLDAQGNKVGTTFWKQIATPSGNFVSKNGRINCKFYRFASLCADPGSACDYMDSTYMLNGKFTDCMLYNGSQYVNWGIENSNMRDVWKMYPERMGLSWSGISETWSIDHWHN